MKTPVSALREIYARIPKETFRYVIAGVLTTLVDFCIFTVLTRLTVRDMLANGISISAAIVFAYIANKLYVFKMHSDSPGALALEFLKFLGGRVFTALLEFWGYPPLLGLLGGRKSIAKAVTIVVVFVLNYVFSKLFVFRGKGKTSKK